MSSGVSFCDHPKSPDEATSQFFGLWQSFLVTDFILGPHPDYDPRRGEVGPAGSWMPAWPQLDKIMTNKSHQTHILQQIYLLLHYFVLLLAIKLLSNMNLMAVVGYDFVHLG